MFHQFLIFYFKDTLEAMDVDKMESVPGSFDETKQKKYPHLLSRLTDYARGVRRFEVPDEKASWQVRIL